MSIIVQCNLNKLGKTILFNGVCFIDGAYHCIKYTVPLHRKGHTINEDVIDTFVSTAADLLIQEKQTPATKQATNIP